VSTRGLGRGLVAVFFIVDAADTAVWLAGVVPEAATLDGPALGLVVARGLVASVEAIAVWLLVRNAPAARPLSIAAVIGAAILTTLIVGLGLAPSDIPPGVRIDVVAAYWLVAVVGAGFAWRQARPVS
jgi:hypothetical protein